MRIRCTPRNAVPHTKKLLLRFLDAEEHLRDAESLGAVISGSRLADGVQRELSPPFSYEAEIEDRARSASMNLRLLNRAEGSPLSVLFSCLPVSRGC